jgi:hypothetical protein
MSRQRVRLDVQGGLANQIIQWIIAFCLSERLAAHLEIDVRVVERPVGRGDQLSALELPGSVVSSSRLARRAWTTSSRLLPERLSSWLQWNVRPRGDVVGTISQVRGISKDSGNVILRGYFQDSEFLMHHRDLVVPLIHASLCRVGGIDRLPASEYAVMHVRRGDYVTNPDIRARFGVCSDEYYLAAARDLDLQMPIRIVTDDPGAVQSLANKLRDTGYRVEFTASDSHFTDLLILACAKRHVLANSSFSWLGAYLSASESVTCPTPWFDQEDVKVDLDVSPWRSRDKYSGALV